MKRILLLLISSLLCFNGFGQFTATLTGSPVNTAGWTLGNESFVNGSSIELTLPLNDQTGYIYYNTPENLTSCAQFTVDFDFRIQQFFGGTVADGIAFWYITNPPGSFNLGESIGIPNNSTGLALVLDTYNNFAPNDVPLATVVNLVDTNYVEDGTVNVLGTPITNQNFIDDGQWHHCTMSYNNGNINVYFNGSATPSITAFYALNLTGYFGFSASTGGSVSTQSIQNVNIVGIETPSPQVISPLTYCQYAVADTLTTVTGTNVSWYTTDTGTVPLPGSPTPNTSVPGTTTYYVSQLPGFCISPKDSIQVIVNPVPLPPVITGDTAYCQNDVFVPFTVTGTNILWYTADTGGVGSPTAPVVNTTVPGTYTYYASQTTTSNGCESKRDSIVVNVYPTPPMPTITGTTTYCQYDVFVPFTVTGTNILWYTTATGGVGSPGAPSVPTNVAGTYTYYASSTINNCEGPRASITVTVNAAPPAPIITGVTDYCPGSTFSAFAATGSNILWYTTAPGAVGDPNTPTISTSVIGADTFYATQTVNGCESQRSIIVINVHDAVDAEWSYTIHRGCTKDTVLFQNNSIGGSFYVWNYGSDGTSDSSITSNPTHAFAHGIYTVYLVATNSSCIDSNMQVIDLRHHESIGFTASVNPVCQGTPVSFANSSIDTSFGNGTGFYAWSFGDGTNDSTFAPSHTYNTVGTYTVKLIQGDLVPCYDSMTVTINVDTISAIAMSLSDSIICAGEEVTFTGDYSNVGLNSVTWNLGDGSFTSGENPLSHSYNAAGTMQVTLTAGYRICPVTSVTKTVIVKPNPLIDLGADTSMCPGSAPITIFDHLNIGNSSARWVWSTGDTSAGITVTQPGFYFSTVDVNDCKATDSIWVKNDCYATIPNSFTPNNDGVNDYFFPRALLSSGITTFKMSVYNRWGEEIYETSVVEGRGWDGSFNGKQQPEGAYVFVIDLTMKNGHIEHHQGTVTLLR